VPRKDAAVRARLVLECPDSDARRRRIRNYSLLTEAGRRPCLASVISDIGGTTGLAFLFDIAGGAGSQ